MWQLQARDSRFGDDWDTIYTGSRAACERLVAAVQDMRCYNRIRIVRVR